MYRGARAEHLTFYETSRGIRNAVAAGRLKRLDPDGNYTLHQVGYPFVQPTTLTFVERLAAQYRAACREPMEVTSAARPATRQPANSSVNSVHPTGMAVDLHKPEDPKCRKWLRESLLDLEGAGVIEATEEFGPPHFHVAVFPTEYRRYVDARERTNARQLATTAVVYRVRPGDTLWDIARDYDISVQALRAANDIDGSVIRPGLELVIPSAR